MCKKYPTKENYDYYAKARNQVKWESRKLVKFKEAQLAKDAKYNSKRFFQYVSSKTKPKETVSNLKKDDGTLTENNCEKANVLNQFFLKELATELSHPLTVLFSKTISEGKIPS